METFNLQLLKEHFMIKLRFNGNGSLTYGSWIYDPLDLNRSKVSELTCMLSTSKRARSRYEGPEPEPDPMTRLESRRDEHSRRMSVNCNEIGS